MRISYIIQVVLACFCSAILPLLFWLVDYRSYRYLSVRIPIIRKFRNRVIRTNNLISTLLLVAIYFRYIGDKDLPVIEIAYLSKIVYLGGLVNL